MFLRTRLLSLPLRSPGIVLAAMTFVLGLALGGGMTSAGIGSAGFLAQRAPAPPPLLLMPPAAAPGPQTVRAAHPAEVLRVLDGDTFEARVHLWPGMDVTTKVRLRGVDAPELKARCAEERIKAEAARDALQSLLAEGDVGISRIGLDKYGGRVLADASTRATPDISVALLAAGLARRYAGGRREAWCRS